MVTGHLAAVVAMETHSNADDDAVITAMCVVVLDSSWRPQIFQEFHSTDMKYKTRLRSRISNLKDQKNPELRRNVLCGNISPQRIASMTAEVSGL